jgi:hypothetical protein
VSLLGHQPWHHVFDALSRYIDRNAISYVVRAGPASYGAASTLAKELTHNHLCEAIPQEAKLRSAAPGVCVSASARGETAAPSTEVERRRSLSGVIRRPFLIGAGSYDLLPALRKSYRCRWRRWLQSQPVGAIKPAGRFPPLTSPSYDPGLARS